MSLYAIGREDPVEPWEVVDILMRCELVERVVKMPAIFCDEQDALDVLFELQELGYRHFSVKALENLKGVAEKYAKRYNGSEE